MRHFLWFSWKFTKFFRILFVLTVHSGAILEYFAWFLHFFDFTIILTLLMKIQWTFNNLCSISNNYCNFCTASMIFVSYCSHFQWNFQLFFQAWKFFMYLFLPIFRNYCVKFQNSVTNIRFLRRMPPLI